MVIDMVCMADKPVFLLLLFYMLVFCLFVLFLHGQQYLVGMWSIGMCVA